MIGLFGKTVPKTTKNFAVLASGEVKKILSLSHPHLILMVAFPGPLCPDRICIWVFFSIVCSLLVCSLTVFIVTPVMSTFVKIKG